MQFAFARLCSWSGNKPLKGGIVVTFAAHVPFDGNVGEAEDPPAGNQRIPYSKCGERTHIGQVENIPSLIQL